MTFFDRFIPSRLTRKIGAMTLSRSISMISALIVAMILTRILPENQYGLYRKLWLVFMLIGPALMGSINGTLYYRGGISTNRDAALITGAALSLMSSLFVGLAGYFGASWFATLFNAAKAVQALQLFSVYMLFAVFAGFAEPLFVLINRKRWLIAYAIIYNILEMGLIVIPFALGCNLRVIVLIMSIGPLLRCLFLIWLLVQSIQKWPDISHFRAELKHSLSFGGGLLLVAIAGMASYEVDKWVVSAHYQSDMIYAIYAVGARKIPFLSAITASITSSLVVHYTSDLSDHKYQSMIPAMRRTTDNLFLLVSPALVFSFFFATQIMVLLFHKYASSAPVFQVYLFTIATQFFFAESVIQGTGNSRINALAGLADLITNLVLSLYLINKIGLIGPAIATLASHIAFQLVMMVYCKVRLGMHFSDFMPTQRIWPLLITLPCFIIVTLFIKKLVPNEWIGMIGTAALGGLLMLLHMKISRKHVAVNRN